MSRRGRKDRLIVCAALTVASLINTIENMFKDVRPFDWMMLCVEIVVTLLILYEIVHPVLKERKINKRRQKINDFVSSGQMLQHTAPADGMRLSQDESQAAKKAAKVWINDVNSWIMDANRFLLTCSSHASTKFLHDSRLNNFPDMSGRYRGDTLVHVETVNRRLNNLQDIMNNPSAYL